MRYGTVSAVVTQFAATLPIAVLVMPMAAMAELPTYQMKIHVGGEMSQVSGINNRGHVSGVKGWPMRAFVWDGTTMRDLGTLGGTYSNATDINDREQVVGLSALAGDLPQHEHAFMYDNGTMTDLGTLGGVYSEADAINNAGQVVGYSYVFDADSGLRLRCFLYENGGMIDLGTLGGADCLAFDINDAGQVTGISSAPNGRLRAFFYDQGTMRDLPTFGGTDNYAKAINVAGYVTGHADTTGDAALHAFLWDGTTMRDLGTLGGTHSSGTDINASGFVTGFSDTATETGRGKTHPFLWDGTRMLDLDTLFLHGDISWGISGPVFINDRGQIAATIWSTDSSGSSFDPRAILLTPISLLISNLRDDVTGVGPGESLANSVATANAYYVAQDLQTTCAALDEFASKVNALSRTKKPKIPPTQADGFIEDGQAIQDALGCP